MRTKRTPFSSVPGPGGGAGASDHDDLTGLSDDDHTQYALSDGSRVGVIAAKGDLLAGTANDVAGRLAVGTTGQHVVADSSQTTGLKYVDSDECITYAVTDAAAAVTIGAGAGTNRWYFKGTGAITAVRATVGTAPTGDDVEIDVNKNGTTIFTTQSNRPIIAATTTTDVTSTIEAGTVVDGDYLTVDIDQVGSVEPGKDLIVQIWWRRA
jgi:hypothetical protein